MSTINPYESAQAPTGIVAESKKPTAWNWYVVYCVLMAILYLLTLAAGVFMIVMAEPIAQEDPEVSPVEMKVTGVALAAISVVLVGMYLFGPRMNRGNSAWIYGLVLIALGMTSACCLPATIPLLIAWVKPETKAWLQNRPN